MHKVRFCHYTIPAQEWKKYVNVQKRALPNLSAHAIVSRLDNTRLFDSASLDVFYDQVFFCSENEAFKECLDGGQIKCQINYSYSDSLKPLAYPIKRRKKSKYLNTYESQALDQLELHVKETMKKDDMKFKAGQFKKEIETHEKLLQLIEMTPSVDYIMPYNLGYVVANKFSHQGWVYVDKYGTSYLNPDINFDIDYGFFDGDNKFDYKPWTDAYDKWKADNCRNRLAFYIEIPPDDDDDVENNVV